MPGFAASLQVTESSLMEMEPRERALWFTLRDTLFLIRVTGFQSAILATGVFPKVIESWLIESTSVRNRGIGDLVIPKAVILQNSPTYFQITVPHIEALKSGQLHKNYSFTSLLFWDL